jgi:nucleotide-binding universal stress UspA family protein
MKTILFPTDFSENAVHASRYAGMMAKLLDANVILLHVYHIPMVPAYNTSFEVKDAVSQNETEIKQQLQTFATEFRRDANLPAERIIQKIEYGFANEKTIEIADSMNVDMIVMGTKGASNILDKWLGTHAQEVMKGANCPVFTVPNDVPIDFPQRILYAADFKDDEIHAVQKVLDIAKPLGATCKVVHIHEEFEPNIGHIVEETIKELETKFKDEDVTVQQFHRTDTIEGLETYIKTYEPDVLAIAIHDKSFLDNIFTTSISQHFIQEAKIPILTFKK